MTTLDAGLTVAPTWHVGSPLRFAEEYARLSSYVAVGGLAARAKDPHLWREIHRAWPALAHRRVHLFGVGATRILRKGRPCSIDMTGWLFAANHGEVYTLTRWPHLRNLDVSPTSSDFSHATVAPLLAEMRHFGSTWTELSTDVFARYRYNVRVLLEVERRLNAREVAQCSETT